MTLEIFLKAVIIVCKCNNIDFGDYSNMEIIYDNKGNKMQVDKCIADEILWLNNIGIKTIASCCGHNKIKGSIAVEEKYVLRMKELGYKQWFNPLWENANNFFFSKSSYSE